MVFEYIEHDLGNYQLPLKSWKQSEWKSQKIGIILTQGEVERMRKSEWESEREWERDIQWENVREKGREREWERER